MFDVKQVVTFEQLGIHAQRPKRPDMAVSTSRLNTFAKWPCSDTHPPQTMVDAGFFYTGISFLNLSIFVLIHIERIIDMTLRKLTFASGELSFLNIDLYRR